MKRWTLLLSLVVLLAGCTGPSPGDPGAGDPGAGDEPKDNGTNGTSGEDNGTDSTEGTEEDPWHRDTRSGEVNGTDAVVVSTAAATEGYNTSQGAEDLYVNLTSTGGELNVTVTPPGCETPDCEERAETEASNASLYFQAPEVGAWSVEMEPAEPGQQNITYELTFAERIRS